MLIRSAVTSLVLLALEPVQAQGLALLGVGLVAIGLIAWLLYRRFGTIAPRTESMPFMEHLEELRQRVLRCGLLVLIWSTLFLTVKVEPLRLGALRLAYPVPSLYENVASQVYRWIVNATVPSGVQVLVTSPWDAVATQMQVSIILALVVCFPFLLYETWAFFNPGLGSREQRVLRRTVAPALILFLIGAAFGFLVVVPMLFNVLYGFAAPLGAVTYLDAGELVGSVLTMVLLFGAAFELPLVMVALVRLGLVRPEAYLRRWRHATIGIFVVAAFASDPTLTSQLIIGCLLLVLYWGGVIVSFLVAPAKPIIRPSRLSKA